jgi:GcrA cell cycle regulator
MTKKGRYKPPHRWDETELATMKELWVSGVSNKTIVEILTKANPHVDYTVQMIVGKCNTEKWPRLVLKQTKTLNKIDNRKARETSAAVFAKQFEFPEDEKCHLAAGKAMDKLAETPNACKWPIGNPKQRGFKFCCSQQQEGSPYCPEHTKLASAQYINPRLKG